MARAAGIPFSGGRRSSQVGLPDATISPALRTWARTKQADDVDTSTLTVPVPWAPTADPGQVCTVVIIGSTPAESTGPVHRRVEAVTVNFAVCEISRVGPTTRASSGL